MKNIRIANRYAKALFTLSLEVNLVEKVKYDMSFIAKTIADSSELKKFLLSPVIKDEKKVKIIKTLFEKHIQAFTLHFLNLIIKKRRFLYIDYIAEDYLNFYRDAHNIKLANLQTASALEPETKDKITSILEEFTQKEIELYVEIKKELIGGFVLKIDDKQYDTSIRTKLLKLSKEFSINIYEKGL